MQRTVTAGENFWTVFQLFCSVLTSSMDPVRAAELQLRRSSVPHFLILMSQSYSELRSSQRARESWGHTEPNCTDQFRRVFQKHNLKSCKNQFLMLQSPEKAAATAFCSPTPVWSWAICIALQNQVRSRELLEKRQSWFVCKQPLLRLFASVKYLFNFKACLTPFLWFSDPWLWTPLCTSGQLHQDTSQVPVKCLMGHIKLSIHCFISGPDNGDGMKQAN